MPLGPRSVSQAITQESLGSLRSCLVEGDAEQRSRERRVRRRSLLISVVIQAAVLALLILLPLFGKTAHIALAVTTPIPPYSPYNGTSHDAGAQHPHRTQQSLCHFCVPPNMPPIIVTHDTRTSGEASNEAPQGLGLGIPGAPSGNGLIPIPDARTPLPPPREDRRGTRPTVVRMTQLDPAMLTHRVEPFYPPLAIQIHREGRVELRAIIATDGTIRSLEIVSGDPIFYQSALEGVRQWHYKPTILNGQPVEIDTHITVIYTVSH